MPAALDHLLLAVADLDHAIAAFAERTGVAPAPGGAHPGFGTRNALVALGSGCYLELIAPDPAQPGTVSRFTRLIGFADTLATVAVRTDDLDGFARAANEAGLHVTAPLRMGRTRPDGTRLDWSLIFADDTSFGPLVPFAIDWRGSPHPSGTAPPGCELQHLVALHPRPERLAALYERLGIAIEVRPASRAGFRADLATPRGPLTFASV